jgi:hypothetical protein
MASGMFSAIRVFMARLLSHELRSPQSCFVARAGLPWHFTTLWTAAAGGIRLTAEPSSMAWSCLI